MPNIETRVAAIFRRGHPIRPLGTTIIEADDEVFIADANHIRAVIPELQRPEHACRHIMIGVVATSVQGLLLTREALFR